MHQTVELNPLLAGALGPLASQFGNLIRHHQPLLGRLFGSSVEHFHVLAIGAHVAAGPAHLLARHLCETDPRKLLAEAIPGHHSALAAALRRMGGVMYPMEVYQRVNALIGTPAERQLLQVSRYEEDGISTALLDRFEAVLELDPLVMAASPALCSIRAARAFHTWVLTLRHLDLLRDEREEARSLSQVAPHGIGTWVMRRLARAVIPDIGFRDTDELAMLRDLASLQAFGRSMDNCLRTETRYHIGMVLGSYAFFKDLGNGGPVAICLSRLAPGVYALDEIAGPKNIDVEDDVRARILDELRAGGIEVTPTSMSQACADLGLGSYGWY